MGNYLVIKNGTRSFAAKWAELEYILLASKSFILEGRVSHCTTQRKLLCVCVEK
jgi:hypothetical protein